MARPGAPPTSAKGTMATIGIERRHSSHSSPISIVVLARLLECFDGFETRDLSEHVGFYHAGPFAIGEAVPPGNERGLLRRVDLRLQACDERRCRLAQCAAHRRTRRQRLPHPAGPRVRGFAGSRVVRICGLQFAALALVLHEGFEAAGPLRGFLAERLPAEHAMGSARGDRERLVGLGGLAGIIPAPYPTMRARRQSRFRA